VFGIVGDPSHIDPRLDARAVTFENPTGARGGGGRAAGGRKGAPSTTVAPGERVVLAELEGPGTVRHLWFTVPPAPPERMRALVLEVFYDGADEPSISVPALDFVGLPHGRPAELYSLLLCAHEARGFNSYVPLPFERSIRMELTNGSSRPVKLYFQVDVTLEPHRDTPPSHLHSAFRRENPTTMRRDMVISDGLRGPGRFLGCVVGVRVLDEGTWYGEGEVKIFRDGDRELPTICGTGLEDYVGTAWGMGRHVGPHAGAPLDVRPPEATGGSQPDFVGFYRFHLADPVMFTSELRVTIQQIGFAMFFAGQEERMAGYEARHPVAGKGWSQPVGGVIGAGIVERVDDYSAIDLVYCREAQPVPRVDVAAATADIARLPYEGADPMEGFLDAAGGIVDP
jgi:hypothetical protein